LNHADTLIYTTEKVLKDIEGKVDASKIAGIKVQIDSLKELLKEKKIDEIKAKVDSLNKLVQEASVELYQKAQKKGPEVHETESGEKVVDGEFEEDDKKK